MHNLYAVDIACGKLVKGHYIFGVVIFDFKSVLKTQEKFYLADASLKYCMMGFSPKSVAAMLENIVYFELRRKGYEVYIGKIQAHLYRQRINTPRNKFIFW